MKKLVMTVAAAGMLVAGSCLSKKGQPGFWLPQPR